MGERMWSTDKDGIIMALLAAEIQVYGQGRGRTLRGTDHRDTARRWSNASMRRQRPPRRRRSRSCLASQVKAHELAGDPIEAILTTAPGNGAPVGGLKVVTCRGWFAARPSGTEDIYKIYAESFAGPAHLRLSAGTGP